MTTVLCEVVHCHPAVQEREVYGVYGCTVQVGACFWVYGYCTGCTVVAGSAVQPYTSPVQ